MIECRYFEKCDSDRETVMRKPGAANEKSDEHDVKLIYAANQSDIWNFAAASGKFDDIGRVKDD